MSSSSLGFVSAARRADSALLVRTRWLRRLSCLVWGHHVDNHVLVTVSPESWSCRCGQPYLARDGRFTRVRHTLSCFLGHHTYERLTDRDGQHEYVCVQCGHPLLFPSNADPYAAESQFAKKVRYLCGLFGHRVKAVATRDGFTEYGCHCGHTFLKSEQALGKITHPLSCVAAGHFIRYVTSRSGYAEYVCRHCGHPFCFAEPRTGAP
jgi:DNA-directed RNA polymerase subunit RPC12/RpoP